MPHMVTFKRASRFYSRNSSGKYQLDVRELRAAFVGSETAAEHIRNFRMERLGKIVAGETPVSLGDGAKIIFHLVPFRSFELGTSYNVIQLPQKERLLGPIDAGGWNYRINFDGFLVIESHATRSTSYGYVQLFRNGCIELVNSSLLSPFNGQLVIPSQSFEDELIQILKPYVSAQRELGIELPIFIMLSFVGVSGYEMGVTPSPFALKRGQPIDRDVLIIPEVMLEDFEFDPAEILRPLFDAVWNAAGWSRSMNYDETGKRKRS
jgi:hypothetical protein